MDKLKLFLMLFAATLLNVSSYACIGSAHSCTSTSDTHVSPLHVDNFDNATSETVQSATTETEASASDLNTTVDLNSFFDEFSLITRDNTRVARVAGLWGFFASALKSIAVWGGVKLTNWIRSKISRRATTYQRKYYEGNRNVIKAAGHWDDLQRRSGCSGREPDHNLNEPGFQDGDDCPICKLQLNDLRT